jgi:hypothetical protein
VFQVVLQFILLLLIVGTPTATNTSNFAFFYGYSAERWANDPNKSWNDTKKNLQDLAENLRKLANSECLRKRAFNQLKDYLSTPEAYGDIAGNTMFGMATSAALPCLRSCFVAGTLVATETGLKPIEQIEPQEKVWSYNQSTSRTELKPVLSAFAKTTELLVNLQIGPDTVVTTLDHPFWVEKIGWTEAGNLNIGDLIKVREGEPLPVTRIEQIPRHETVYNLEVETLGNFFVSESEFLVHNNNNWCFGFGKAPKGFSNIDFGNKIHGKFEKVLMEQTGTKKGDWFMRTKPGQTGIDAEYIGPPSKNPGFDYAELKPHSPGSVGTFGSQLDRWGLPNGKTQLWYYNHGGIIGSSGFNF